VEEASGAPGLREQIFVGKLNGEFWASEENEVGVDVSRWMAEKHSPPG